MQCSELSGSLTWSSASLSESKLIDDFRSLAGCSSGLGLSPDSPSLSQGIMGDELQRQDVWKQVDGGQLRSGVGRLGAFFSEPFLDGRPAVAIQVMSLSPAQNEVRRPGVSQ